MKYNCGKFETRLRLLHHMLCNMILECTDLYSPRNMIEIFDIMLTE